CLTHTRLKIRQFYQAVRYLEPIPELSFNLKITIHQGKLKIGRYTTSPILEPYLAVIVLCHSPLAVGAAGRLLNYPIGRPADPLRIIGTVHPVIHGTG